MPTASKNVTCVLVACLLMLASEDASASKRSVQKTFEQACLREDGTRDCSRDLWLMCSKRHGYATNGHKDCFLREQAKRKARRGTR
jgi:hypothetical protein